SAPGGARPKSAVVMPQLGMAKSTCQRSRAIEICSGGSIAMRLVAGSLSSWCARVHGEAAGAEAESTAETRKTQRRQVRSTAETRKTPRGLIGELFGVRSMVPRLLGPVGPQPGIASRALSPILPYEDPNHAPCLEAMLPGRACVPCHCTCRAVREGAAAAEFCHYLLR